MKTPKRTHCDIYKCDKCGGYGITYKADDATYALFQCSLCGAQWHMPFLPKRTLAIRTRWKRKNREAKLRRKIDLLNSQLFLCSWFIERHMGLASKFTKFVKETPVECCQGEKLIETRYFTVARRDVEGS